jgi:uroporphyrinogen-III decarboxylase
MVAVEMVGTDFYTWLYDYPEVCHRFLDKITTALIEAEEKFRKIDPRPRSIYGLAEDDGCNISEATFKEFSLPYDVRMYDHFGAGLVDGRSLHNCGPSNHLLDTYIKDLKISTYSLYGYSCTPEIAAEKLAGKCYLWGNISPMLLHSGPKEDIAAYTRHYFDILAPYGGIVFGDGANCVPGTPLEHMAVCVDVAEEYAKDHTDMFTDDLENFFADGIINVGASGKNFVI